MTPAEMDEACRHARAGLDNHSLDCDCGWCGNARALLAAVGERDALRDLCAALNGDGGHMQVAEGTVAAVEAALDRWHALQARAVAAEQRAEAAERALAARGDCGVRRARILVQVAVYVHPLAQLGRARGGIVSKEWLCNDCGLRTPIDMDKCPECKSDDWVKVTAEPRITPAMLARLRRKLGVWTAMNKTAMVAEIEKWAARENARTRLCPCDGWYSNSVGGAWKTEKTHCPRCGEALPPERAFELCAACEAAMEKEFPSE